MITGQVRSLPEGKLFGFISTDTAGDIFFHKEDFSGHWNDLVRDFRKGKTVIVEFELVDSAKGLRAATVSRTDYPNQVG